MSFEARARAKSLYDTTDTNVRAKLSSAHVKDDNLSVKNDVDSMRVP